MDIKHPRSLKAAARSSLENARCDARKLLFIHIGITLGLSALLSLLDYAVEQGIGNTSGLSNMGLRSMLETAQTVLRMAHSLALPFWQMGYLFLTLKLARGESASAGTLLEGFRNFRPIIRYELLCIILITGVVMASTYLSTGIYLMTPFSNAAVEELNALLQTGTEDTVALQEAMTLILSNHIWPIAILFAAVCLGIGIPIYYRYRMSDLALVDHPEKGAIHALGSSRKLMRKNCLKLVKLDLSFWWFYLLEALVIAIAYTDALLPAIGVTLPLHEDVQYFLFYFLSLGGQLGIYWLYKNYVSVTYAHAYVALLPKYEETTGDAL